MQNQESSNSHDPVITPAPQLSRRTALGRLFGGAMLFGALPAILPQTARSQSSPESSGQAQAPNGRSVIPQTPDGATIVPPGPPGSVKRVTLTASVVEQELLNADGKHVVAKAYGYNGSSPGPTLVFTESDRVEITLVNQLPEPTTVHWHGVIVPNSQDGSPDVGEPTPIIPPGGSYTYKFPILQAGTHMYHAHQDAAKQDLLGLAGGLVLLPLQEHGPRIDADYIYFLAEWSMPQRLTGEQIRTLPRTGSPTDTVNSVNAEPDWTADARNFFSMNGKCFPSTTALRMQLGERIRVRFYNIGLSSHTMHFHGQDFFHVEEDGNPIAKPPQINTIDVGPGKTQAVEIVGINPGVWPFHCHFAHHQSNNLSSGFGGMSTRVFIT